MKRVAVIGGGIGGLSAAGELARAGHSVTLFEGSDTLGGKAQVVTHHGLTLDTGPTLLTMPETVRQTFRRLDAESLLPKFHRLELQSQYRYADGRDFFAWEDGARAEASASALEPSEGAALHAFYDEAAAIFRAAGEPYLEAPYQGMPSFMARVIKRGLGTMLTGLKLSTLDQLARKYFKTEYLRQFVGRFATYAGGSPYEASAAFAMIPHLERAFGVHHVEGGMGTLVTALGRAVSNLGVDVRYGARAQWSQRKQSFLAGPAGDEREFDVVVVNQDPLLSLGREKDPLAMSGYVFFVDVPKRLTLPHHLIVFSKDYAKEFSELFSGTVPTDPTICVCHPAATDRTMAPEGRSGLFVMVNVPAFTDEARAQSEWGRSGATPFPSGVEGLPVHSSRSPHRAATLGRADELPFDSAQGERGSFDSAQGERGSFDSAQGERGSFDSAQGERIQSLCLAQLRGHFPELAGLELTVFGDRTPLDLAARGAPGGSIYGFLPHGKFGPFRRPHLEGPQPGLFFAGGGTHPGGGVPLVMLSGRFAAGLALAHLGGAR